MHGIKVNLMGPTICRASRTDLALAMSVPASLQILKSEDIWIGDTGASNHCTFSNIGIYNTQYTGTSTTVGASGGGLEPKYHGDLHVIACNKEGMTYGKFKLKGVSYSNQYNFNLFSISRVVEQGWKLSGDKECLTLVSPCGQAEIKFDIVIKTARGCIFATLLSRVTDVAAANVTKSMKPDKPKKVNITLREAHAKLGHCDKEKAKRTATALGWNLTETTMTPCESCAMGKAKQKNVPKRSTRVKATKAGERIYHDISTIMGNEELGCPKSQWHCCMDEFSQFTLSKFYKKKNQFIEPFLQFLRSLENRLLEVKFIRMDNSGENKKFWKRAKASDWQFKFEAEYTARNTPQQNGLIEVKIATVAGRARAMCNAANMDQEIRHFIADEALSHATDLDNLIVDSLHDKTRFERFGLPIPKWAATGLIKTFGEAGIVKRGKGSKLQDRGVPMIFVGYAANHAHDCYRMWNPVSKQITETRDVIWLHRMYYQNDVSGIGLLPRIKLHEEHILSDAMRVMYPGLLEAGGSDPVLNRSDWESEDTPPPIKECEDNSHGDSVHEDREGDDSDEESTESNKSSDSTHTDVSQTEPEDKHNEELYRTRYGRVPKQRDLYQPGTVMMEMGAMVAEMNLMANGMDSKSTHEVMMVGATGEGFDNTNELRVMTYDEAIREPDAKEWQLEIDKEHERMMSHKAWIAVPRSEVPKGTKILGSTWAMKRKANGTRRARLNTKGCSQRPGLHYDEDNISSPVTNLTSIRIAFIIMIMADMVGWVKDVNGAFLTGEFQATDPVLYMHIPKGMEKWYKHLEGEHVLKLLVPIYGTKQAARCYFDKAKGVLRKLGYEGSKADPCLFLKWMKDYGLAMCLTWVDDKLFIAHKDKIMAEKDGLSKHFKCDDVGELEDYVGCKIDVDRENRKMTISQPVLVQSLFDEFGDIPQGKIVLTPAQPGSVLMKGEETGVLDEAMHKRYRSGVGKLMYLAKHTRPDISNAVRDLARHMHAPNQGHWKAMEHWS